MLQKVVPYIALGYERKVALVLGKALLWCYFSSESEVMIPQNIRKRIKDAFVDDIRGDLGENENPIRKKPIIPSQANGVVFLDEADDDVDGEANDTNVIANLNSPGDARRLNNSINNIILCRVNELTIVLNKNMEDNIAQSNA